MRSIIFNITAHLIYCNHVLSRSLKMCHGTCNTTQDTNKASTTENLSLIDEDFFAYKAGVFINLYFTVPIAVWGWTGNCLSFRYLDLHYLFSYTRNA